MIRRLLTVWFSLFVWSFIIMGVAFVGLSQRAANNFGTIANVDAPVLITMGQIESAATRVQLEALSIASLIAASEEPVTLDWDALRVQAAANPVEEGAAGAAGLAAEIQSESIQFLAAANTVSDLLDTYASLEANSEDADSAEVQGALNDLRDAATAIYDEGITLINLAASGADPAEYLNRMEAVESHLEEVVSAAMTLERGELDAIAGTVLRNVGVFTVVAIVLTFGIAGAAILIALTSGKSLVDNVEKMRSVARAVEAGRLDVRTDGKGSGEVGELQHAFNTMLDRIQERDQSLATANDQLAMRVIETEEARASAERSNQVKSAFLASMSHELRTPLNAVINFTRFVLDGDTGPINDQQSELLAEVVTSGRHLLNLINDVLDMSKIEAGSLNLFIEDDVDLAGLLTGLETTSRSLLLDKPVTFRTEIAPDLPMIRADRQRILQILLNMVSNACKFTEKGEITLRAYQRDGEVLMEVTDTGPGIEPEDQAMVFEAFKQTRSGLRQGGGTGLGMPIARSLAEAHGGKMWLESEPGHGTTFFVALPLLPEVLVAEAA